MQQQTTRRRFHTWVTDMVYMRNTQNLALTTSNREIYFYDISTPVYTIEFCLYGKMLQKCLFIFEFSSVFMVRREKSFGLKEKQGVGGNISGIWLSKSSNLFKLITSLK